MTELTRYLLLATLALLAAPLGAQGLPDLSRFGVGTAAGTDADAGQIVDCLLEPSEQVTISSPIPGVIDEIHVERGDVVRKGQPIAELQSSLEQAQVALRQARVEFSTRKLVRNEQLFKEDLISEHELDEIRTERQLAIMEMEEAKVVLAQKRIGSPFDGVVIQRHQSPGQYVTNEPIVTLVKTDVINAEVMLPAAMLASVREGARVVIEPEFPVGSRHAGTVTLVDRVVDPSSGTFGIRAALANPDRRIFAGVHCKATLE
ncbi:MAG TPA: efflux RND transporter periplasmic adaptor subunit [Gammaproteobacteria bacterium]